MKSEKTTGTIKKLHKLLCLKINRKAVRKNPVDGSFFPCVALIEYEIEGKIYKKRKILKNYDNTYLKNGKITVFYKKENPRKIFVL